MFYATRTHKIAADINEKQLLAFYTKKQRDEYVNFEGGESITAKQKNNLTLTGKSFSAKGESCIFFVQRFI